MECSPQGIYRPRDAQATVLYHLVEDNFDELERVWDDRYEKQHGFWRPVIERILRHLKLWNRPERPPPPALERSIHYDPEVIACDDLDQRQSPLPFARLPAWRENAAHSYQRSAV